MKFLKRGAVVVEAGEEIGSHAAAGELLLLLKRLEGP
jgi:hypothetical protein